MSQAVEKERQFVVDLLTTLRQDKFSLTGWWRFLGRSWEMSCKTANENPSLKRSWMLVTLLIGILALLFFLPISCSRDPA